MVVNKTISISDDNYLNLMEDFKKGKKVSKIINDLLAALYKSKTGTLEYNCRLCDSLAAKELNGLCPACLEAKTEADIKNLVDKRAKNNAKRQEAERLENFVRDKEIKKQQKRLETNLEIAEINYNQHVSGRKEYQKKFGRSQYQAEKLAYRNSINRRRKELAEIGDGK